MPSIPIWLIGRNVTSVAITPQVANAAGLLSNSTVGQKTITTVVDEINYGGQITTQEISALTASRENPVPIEQDDTLVITEILRQAAGSNNLAACWNGSDNPDVALFQFTRGGNACSFYGLMSDLEYDVEKGKSVVRMTLKIVDTGAGINQNPAYS
jgi:hypothetical protein